MKRAKPKAAWCWIQDGYPVDVAVVKAAVFLRAKASGRPGEIVRYLPASRSSESALRIAVMALCKIAANRSRTVHGYRSSLWKTHDAKDALTRISRIRRGR